MRQRLGIARALINRPQVLFPDEPTLGLDPAGREDVLARLSEIASEQGPSVVLCSHLLDDVERICDRIAILHHGKVISAGAVADVIGDSDLASAATITVEPGYRDDAVDILGAQPAWPWQQPTPAAAVRSISNCRSPTMTRTNSCGRCLTLISPSPVCRAIARG